MDISIRNQLSNLKSFPFCSGNIVYYSSGRNALWHAMKVLMLSPDDEVLIPSYNCGAEIDPIVKWGAKVKLYEIDSMLRIDFGKLREKINRDTKAILVIHYFGFPQPVDEIRKICDENGLYLIEDCAHALFSIYKDKPLGSFGDISIFSLRKMLPVPDGGVLVINDSNLLDQTEKLTWPPLIYELSNLLNQLLFGIKSNTLVLASKFISDLCKKTKFTVCDSHTEMNELPQNLYDYRIDLKKVNWMISRVSTLFLKKIAKDKGIDYIIRKLQNNFTLFLRELKDLTTINLIFDHLPDGVCPSRFPILVKKRDEAHEFLLKKGIFTFKTWPSFYPGLSWEQFPTAVFLKNHVISFPIHYRITEKDILKSTKLLGKLK